MITGQRIRLRAWEREDLRLIWTWENDTEVMEFSSCSPERCVAFEKIERIFENALTPGPGGPWSYIIETEDRRAIGTTAYWLPNTRFTRSAEIGLYIGDRKAWGKGYGTDVIMTMAHMLFQELGFHRIALSYGSYNTRMAHLVESCGIPQEGVMREERFMHGRYYDTIRAGIVSRDFEVVYSAWIKRTGSQVEV